MLTSNDFSKKQIVFCFCNDGEHLCLQNDNLIIKGTDNNVKLQVSCYRLFLVFVIGRCSITTPLLQKANKYGFSFAMMTTGFKLYSLIGARKDGNTLLKKRQYAYDGIGIARRIVANKIHNQTTVLKNIRDKNEYVKEAISLLKEYLKKAEEADDLHQLMAYEGLASNLYFKNIFNNVIWRGRQPRLKRDYINSALDIGYTLLFNFIDAICGSYGFDTYCGVLHTQFYMRKSLVCDLVEPFRVIIDTAIKKAINLKQIQEGDFLFVNQQYQLKWEKSAEYARFLMTPILERKNDIFDYIQRYYRAFMKRIPENNYPFFQI